MSSLKALEVDPWTQWTLESEGPGFKFQFCYFLWPQAINFISVGLHLLVYRMEIEICCLSLLKRLPMVCSEALAQCLAQNRHSRKGGCYSLSYSLSSNSSLERNPVGKVGRFWYQGHQRGTGLVHRASRLPRRGVSSRYAEPGLGVEWAWSLGKPYDHWAPG